MDYRVSIPPELAKLDDLNSSVLNVIRLVRLGTYTASVYFIEGMKTQVYLLPPIPNLRGYHPIACSGKSHLGA